MTRDRNRHFGKNIDKNYETTWSTRDYIILLAKRQLKLLVIGKEPRIRNYKLELANQFVIYEPIIKQSLRQGVSRATYLNKDPHSTFWLEIKK